MSVFRAVENRVPLARCANTGLTFFVDTRGRVYERGGAFTREIRVARLDRAGDPPLFTRWGDWVGRTVLVITALLVLASAWPRRVRF
jgi:apolipoprotein N-acyltransferase